MFYNNLNNEECLKIQEYLTPFEKAITPLMNKWGFELFNTEKAGLGIQYNYRGQIFLGSIGFIFDDNLPRTFSFWIIKTYDMDEKRYWKRIEILKNVPLSEITSRIQELFEDALDKFNSMQMIDLTEVIDMSSYPPKKNK